jgi:RNA polymerase sigma factor (sigma-70 family)
MVTIPVGWLDSSQQPDEQRRAMRAGGAVVLSRSRAVGRVACHDVGWTGHRQDVMTEQAPNDVTVGFEAAYRRWYPEVYRYVRRRIGDDVAADVTAEVFSVAWRRNDVFSRADFPLAWLYGVARHSVANARRAHRRRLALLEKAGLDAAPSHHQPDTEVLDALAGLRQGDREVLMLVAWEGLTGPDLAAALGCSEAAARQRLSRARSRLAAALAEGGPR